MGYDIGNVVQNKINVKEHLCWGLSPVSTKPIFSRFCHRPAAGLVDTL